ncbi:MAG: glycine--tRNA ligase subunit beta [Gammaproteobacteria bacterium]|nr:glycine--tRNA ligase subunit beta [Gammaproteobacteria bacterium]
MGNRDLLIEIGTEELPPKALKNLAEAFYNGVRIGLEKAGLSHGEIALFATPRRIATLIPNLDETQADKQVERRGPAVKAAFGADGNPSKAALGFARSCGVEVDALERVETPKGAWLVFRSTQSGQSTSGLVPGIVRESLARLPIPKRMRWGDLKVEFVRPAHWIVLLFGDEVIDTEILGIKAGRKTHGHRFHHPENITITTPAEYPVLLRETGQVLADFPTRREEIRRQVEILAGELGGKAVISEGLLDEVTSLVEWPVAIAGSFDQRFLEVPAEALVATMKGHQKYFHLEDSDGNLLPHFITVSNIESSNPDAVRAGNERVIRPRLTDAEFFWQQDRATPLAARVSTLKNVVFQQKLGTLRDKSRRVVHLAEQISSRLGSDPDLGRRAAELSKCDLSTDMVGEFPELQGIMGRYYAHHDGEPDEVAQALDEQYLPRFAGDILPETTTGQALAIADRLDTLVGIFAIGQSPTGDKDPFGLRRAALGVLRIIIERQLDLDLKDLLRTAVHAYGQFDIDLVVDEVFTFMMERLRAYYLDTGVATDTFEAVLARHPDRPLDFDERIKAVTRFRELPDAASLAAANKRIHNILRKAKGTIPESPDPARFEDSAEGTLAAEIEKLRKTVEPMLELGEYTEALSQLAGLRDTVDRFFDQVLVMADDEELRHNRLALLASLNRLFLRTADISRLVKQV